LSLSLGFEKKKEEIKIKKKEKKNERIEGKKEKREKR
jgi:hypothetical protein